MTPSLNLATLEPHSTTELSSVGNQAQALTASSWSSTEGAANQSNETMPYSWSDILNSALSVNAAKNDIELSAKSPSTKNPVSTAANDLKASQFAGGSKNALASSNTDSNIASSSKLTLTSSAPKLSSTPEVDTIVSTSNPIKGSEIYVPALSPVNSADTSTIPSGASRLEVSSPGFKISEHSYIKQTIGNDHTLSPGYTTGVKTTTTGSFTQSVTGNTARPVSAGQQATTSEIPTVDSVTNEMTKSELPTSPAAPFVHSIFGANIEVNSKTTMKIHDTSVKSILPDPGTFKSASSKSSNVNAATASSGQTVTQNSVVDILAPVLPTVPIPANISSAQSNTALVDSSHADRSSISSNSSTIETWSKDFEGTQVGKSIVGQVDSSASNVKDLKLSTATFQEGRGASSQNNSGDQSVTGSPLATDTQPSGGESHSRSTQQVADILNETNAKAPALDSVVSPQDSAHSQKLQFAEAVSSIQTVGPVTKGIVAAKVQEPTSTQLTTQFIEPKSEQITIQPTTGNVEATTASNHKPSVDVESAPSLKQTSFQSVKTKASAGASVNTAPDIALKSDMSVIEKTAEVTTMNAHAISSEAATTLNAHPTSQVSDVIAYSGNSTHSFLNFAQAAHTPVPTGSATTTNAGAGMNNLLNPFQSMDSSEKDQSSLPANWMRASSYQIESGYHDPTLGWVGVRATDNGGIIHASLSTSTTAATEVMGTHLAPLTAQLASEHANFASLDLSSNAQGANAGSHSGHGQHAEEQGQNQASEMSFASTDLNAERNEVSIASNSTVPIELGIGQSVSVLA